ncbi:hypothetical protein EMIT0158MI4_30174 [Burkholderia ambifaria]
MVATHRYRTKGQPRLPFFVSARPATAGRRPEEPPDAQHPARLQCRMLETGSTARARAGRP